MKKSRVILAQTNPSLGDVGANLEGHLRQIDEAAAAGANAVLFPELSLTGYFLKDQTYELAMSLDAEILSRVAEKSRSIAVGAGFVERSADGRYYNAYAYFEGGKIVHVHRKVHLVSYGLFEETRDFAAGTSFESFDTGLGRVGILICEDLWHMPSSYLHFLQGAETLLVPSCSPARGVGTQGQGFASERTWQSLLAAVAMFTRTNILYVNRVGFEDGIGFSGGSCAIGPRGDRVHFLEGLDEGSLEVELDSGALRRARVQTPLLRDEKPGLVVSELARIHPELFTSPPAGDA